MRQEKNDDKKDGAVCNDVGCGNHFVGCKKDKVADAESVKVGLLHSLTGSMAISEKAVRDAEVLAISEINAAGGVLGKQIVYR